MKPQLVIPAVASLRFGVHALRHEVDSEQWTVDSAFLFRLRLKALGHRGQALVEFLFKAPL
jgi:hypothetical protein